MKAKRGVIRTGGGRLGSHLGGIRISLKPAGGKKKRKKPKPNTEKQNLKPTGTKRRAQPESTGNASQRDIERRLAEQRLRASKWSK
jgi:hypothetical protein